MLKVQSLIQLGTKKLFLPPAFGTCQLFHLSGGLGSAFMALLNSQQERDKNNKVESDRELRATKVPIENRGN